MPLDRHKTIRQALDYVTRNPEWPDPTQMLRIDMPMWELICRQLYDMANHPDPTNRASVMRSLRASKLILNRQSGTRRMGTHPAVRRSKQLTFVDLTVPSTEKPEDSNGS